MKRDLTPEIKKLIDDRIKQYIADEVSRQRTAKRGRPRSVRSENSILYKPSVAGRQIAVYLVYNTSDLDQRQVADIYGYSAPSAVSLMCSRVEDFRLENEGFNTFISELEQDIFALRRHANVAEVI